MPTTDANGPSGPEQAPTKKRKSHGRRLTTREIKRLEALSGRGLGLEILGRIQEGGNEIRLISIPRDLLDNPKTDIRTKFEIWRDLKNMVYGRPAETKESPTKQKSNVVEVPTTMNLQEWEKLVESGKKPE